MTFLHSLIRCKAHDAEHAHASLRRVLGAFDLTMLGIGAIIGAGIFVLTGVAAATQAGPAIMLSYLIAGIACCFSAFAYAELASSVGGCGSAYSYTYVSLGELLAWLIGWDLLLEYGLGTTAVAVGWSGYVVSGLASIGIHIPPALCLSPFDHGIINLPAMFIIFAVTGLLVLGTKRSARFNSLIVCIKLAVILFFILVASFHFKISNWHPFMPFGFHGVVTGAALIFFAFIGFDAVSTAAEETINPQRNLPIGILTSLGICTLLYIVASGLLTGIAPLAILNVSSPVSNALLNLGLNFAAGVIAAGAIAGLTTVIIVLFYGLTRIFLSMSRDGLIPGVFSYINPKTQTPTRVIYISGCIMALIAGFIPIQRLAELVNIGTLAAFTLVCLSVIILRRSKPAMLRPFKTPFSPVIPFCGIALNLFLMVSLPALTWVCFVIWALIGLTIYFTYGRRHSMVGKSENQS